MRRINQILTARIDAENKLFSIVRITVWNAEAYQSGADLEREFIARLK